MSHFHFRLFFYTLPCWPAPKKKNNRYTFSSIGLWTDIYSFHSTWLIELANGWIWTWALAITVSVHIHRYCVCLIDEHFLWVIPYCFCILTKSYSFSLGLLIFLFFLSFSHTLAISIDDSEKNNVFIDFWFGICFNLIFNIEIDGF